MKNNRRYQADYYPELVPAPTPPKDGELKVGELITNMATEYVWAATQFDVNTIKPDTYEEHAWKYRRMIPMI